MRLIIAGSRHLDVSTHYIEETLHTFGIAVKDITEVVSGNAQGIDHNGEEFSIEFLNKEAKGFPADWSRGSIAGSERNELMAEYSDALLLIWDGKSDGSADMKMQMMKLRKPIYEVTLRWPKQ